MNKAILHPAVQKFVNEHLQDGISKLILKGSPFPEITEQELAVQISGRKRAKTKLPSWFENRNVLYPPNLNMEQTSSEITAAYKANLIGGETIADLTGGFGIDSYYFSKRFKKVVHLEQNKDLSQIATHNFSHLAAVNIFTVTGDGVEYLRSSTEKFDYLYLDPSRRDDYGGKVFHLDQCSPDVPEHLELLFSKAENLMLKTSPLLDLKSGISQLKNVVGIHIVAVNNEVKELVWLLKRSYSEKVKIITVNLQPSVDQVFETCYEDDQIGVPLSLPEKFLFEPNAAVMKSGMFKALALKTGTKKLHHNSHLYTSSEIVEFPGRSFEIVECSGFNRKHLKKRFKGKKTNITTRNFPSSVENLRKDLRIKDGGDNFLFFSTDLKENKIVLECRKISAERVE